MKLLKVLKNSFLLSIASAVFLSVPFFALASEKIDSFASYIYLEQDGSFKVEEVITYNFGDEARHGIYRYIDKKHPQGSSSVLKKRTIGIELLDIKQNNNDVPYEVSDFGEKFEVKIGDPDLTLSGVQTYTISYRVEGGYSYLDDGFAEIYWNVTGNGWEVPIESVVANLYTDADLMTGNHACYAGALGAVSPCAQMLTEEDGSISFFASSLAPYEGLTIAQSLDAQKIEVRVLERYNFILLLVIILPFLALGIGVFGYRYRTEHKTGKPIIAQYEPYKDFKPMYTGMLFDGRLDPQDITAGIVYLAEQGFLKIRKVEKKVMFLFEVDDYQLQLMRPFSEIESAYLKDVLLLIFYENAPIGDVVTLSSLKTDFAKQKVNAVKLQTLRTDLKKDLERSGFFQTNKMAQILLFVFGGFLFLMFFIGELVFLLLGLETLLLFIVAMVCGLILSIFMFERRTRIGYEALDHLKGFKQFLSVTDKERFEFHNAPQKSPEQFMEYLPYAIAFGVEKQWAKAFEGITIPNPTWYDGGSAGSFAAADLTTSLGAFSTSFAASSGSSASSGGGSSGGGGGGGGGGSW